MKNEKLKSFSEPDEIVELSYLYDFYGALLKENHRQIFEDYIWNNLSLGEIASSRDITRQGVYDVICRCRIRLRDYEEKLQLVYKFQQTRERLREIEGIADSQLAPEPARSIHCLAEEIYDMI